MSSDAPSLVKARWVGPFRTLFNGEEYDPGDTVEDVPEAALQSGHWKQVNSRAAKPAEGED